MSLIRQIWWLLLGSLLLAFAGAVGVTTLSARDTLQTQLQLKNNDNAQSLALALSQQRGEPALMDLVLSAQFDTGFYRTIRFVATDGKTGFSREATGKALHAPDWFVALVPIDSVPGVAQVSDGWRALGSITVVSQASYAHDELWRGSQRAALALAVVGVVAGLLASLGVRRIRRPLDDTVRQAASLQRGEYLTVTEPNVPELRRLTRAMNSMVERLRVVFEGQAAQVESMRRQASCDALTGLSNRIHFMAKLNASLQREDGAPTGGLVLLRVLQLAEVNRVLGRADTDRLIVTIGAALQGWAERVPEAFAGRLNGADFALGLPAGGVARESAQAVVELLRVALPAFTMQVGVVAGAVETRRAMPLGELMGQADLALARAEAAGRFSVESAGDGGAGASAWASLGDHGWNERLRASLGTGRARLGSFPVVDRAQVLIHLECPLRLQLEPDGAFEVAGQWLPLAVRARLTPAIDEHALALALTAIEADGLSRCVNLSPASLADSGFAARLRTLLLRHESAARRVWLEINESAAADHFELVRELARQLRPLGVRFGLEHAGERLSRIERLFEAGLDYVKLDASVIRDVGLDAGRAGFVKGLVTMLHSLELQVIAEGVSDAADAHSLWECGADGVTGPWVSAQPNSPPV
jgi:EAL domain-containing protein (putative c-di-GMP-specific phosphodiesterase class I)/GGDEF domain-containing protein